MSVEFMIRIPTEAYGYVEAKADTFNEFVQAVAEVQDLVNGAPPVTEERAIQNLQDQGLVRPNPGLRGPVQQNQPQQEQQQWQPSVAEEQPPQEFCQHGPKKWVPGGFSKRTNAPYKGFYACPAPQGQQCRRGN